MKIFIDGLKNKFSSNSYYQGAKCLINHVNDQFGWERGVIDTDLYEAHYVDIIRWILSHYTVSNPSTLSARMATIAAPMKVAGYTGEFVSRAATVSQQVPIASLPLDKPNIPWSEMLKTLQSVENATQNKGAVVICTTYRHGYVMRCSEIALTTTDGRDRDRFNYLDMDTGVWYIRSEHTKNRKSREFTVSQEYLDEIRSYIRHTGFLVGKTNGKPYTGRFCLSTVGITEFTVNDVRNSYETMNYARTDISEEQKVWISEMVLGHTGRTARAHYTPQITLT